MKKRILAALTCLIMLISLHPAPSITNAVEIEGLIHTETGLNDLNIRSTIATYFSQREDFLKGLRTDIPIAISVMLPDEEKHKSAIAEAAASLLETTIEIADISIDEHIADVALNEISTYVINESILEVTIIHDITVYQMDSGSLQIARDGYYDSAVNFYSCSFIDRTEESLDPMLASGGASCIIAVARNEIGYTETGENITKYGAYFGKSGFEWCASFVAWCAIHANVPDSVIFRTTGCEQMRDDFYNDGRYFLSRAQGGTTTPQMGDIIFIYGTPLSPDHVGIVTSVEGSIVYYVNGNDDDQVKMNSFNLSDTSIMCYGRPAYAITGHTYGVSLTYDAHQHWRECVNCHIPKQEYGAHSFSYNSSTGKYICSVCGYSTTNPPVAPVNIDNETE